MGGPLSPETLVYGLENGNDARVSPDGTRVAYTLNRVDAESHRPRRQIWICGVDGADPRLVLPPDEEGSNPTWSPDGSRLALTAGGAVVVVEPSAREGRRELVRHPHSVGDLAWAPDGRALAYTTLFDPENPDGRAAPDGAAPTVRVTRRLDYKEDGRGYLGDTRKQAFVVSLDAPGSRQLTSAAVDHDSLAWSPDGSKLGMRVYLPDRAGTGVVLVDLDSGAEETVVSGPGAIVHWSWSPDGQRILYARDPDMLQPDYFVYDRASGETRRVTTDLRSSPDSPQPVWLDETRALVHAFLAGASVLQVIDADTGHVETIEHSQARNAGLSVDDLGRFVVQSESSLTSIGEIRVFDRERGDARTITAHNADALELHPAAEWETFTVQRAGFEIDAWLLKPPGFDPGWCYPVVLDVHGGPSSHYGYGFLAHEQCLATNGFLVLFANVRGSTSYGRDFAQQVIRDWGRGDYEDYLAVLDELLLRPYADAERTGIFGISYGGYMTSWAIGQTDRFKAAVCGEPIFDLESDYGTSDVAFNGLERHGGGPPHAEREWYESHSPSTYAHRIRTPTLIFHGEADHRCPIGQSEQMFVALRKAGCETEFVRYPGGSHMFFATGVPEHRVDLLTRILAWFKKYLGDPA